MNVLRILWVEAIVTALALCLVWQARESVQAGYLLDARQRQVEACEAEVQALRAHVSKLQSPHRILMLVHSLELPIEPLPAGRLVELRRQPEPLDLAGTPPGAPAEPRQ